MTQEEYVRLFHKEQLNLVAFKMLFQCDKEVLRLVNAAIAAEREACAKLCDGYADSGSDHEAGAALNIQAAIRARGDSNAP
jgi:hypothetical protein